MAYHHKQTHLKTVLFQSRRHLRLSLLKNGIQHKFLKTLLLQVSSANLGLHMVNSANKLDQGYLDKKKNYALWKLAGKELCAPKAQGFD